MSEVQVVEAFIPSFDNTFTMMAATDQMIYIAGIIEVNGPDPSHPNNVGEFSNFSGISNVYHRLYSSSDNGQTWTLVNEVHLFDVIYTAAYVQTYQGGGTTLQPSTIQIVNVNSTFTCPWPNSGGRNSAVFPPWNQLYMLQTQEIASSSS
ncbi:MAG: hypothetical protein ACLQBD_01145 [Syntrophobacteraceae bacterium]